MTTQTVGFTITGEFVTEHARDLLIEGDWEGAYRFLTNYIDGIDHEIAVSLLKGEKRLTGKAGGEVNTLDLEDETPERRAEIEERCNYLWAGTVRVRPDYLKPYAVVTNFGPQDVGAAGTHGNDKYDLPPEDVGCIPGNSAKISKWNASRCCEYMNDQRNDHVYLVKCPDGDTRFVLFEKVNATPIWWEPISCGGDWQTEAVSQWVETHGAFPERGHQQTFENRSTFDDFRDAIDELDPDDVNDEVSRRLDTIMSGGDRGDFLKEQMKSQIEKLGVGMDSDAIAGTVDYIFQTGDGDVPPEAVEPDADTKYGWITRDGKFYACAYHHHAELAGRIFKFVERMEEPPADPEKAGDDAGWLKLTKSAFGGKFSAYHTKPLTERQKRTLEDWAAWHSVNLDEALTRL